MCLSKIYNSSHCFIIELYIFVSYLDWDFQGKDEVFIFLSPVYTSVPGIKSKCFVKEQRNIPFPSCLQWYYHYNGTFFFKDTSHWLLLMLSIFPCLFNRWIICCVIVYVLCPFMCWDRPLYCHHQSECPFSFSKCLYRIYDLPSVALSAWQILTHLILAKTLRNRCY